MHGAKALPEDSIAMRFVVALAVEIGLLAVISQGVVGDSTALLTLILAPAGYWFSYVRRERRNTVVKIALAVGLLVALERFLAQMSTVTSADAARTPLAVLFIWVQVLHALDVPRRRDLAFSMVSSTTLIAVGGALALTSSYLGLLLAWAVLAGTWMWLSARPLAGDVTAGVAIARQRPTRPARSASARSILATALAALVLAMAMFSLMPRIPATMVRALPFRLSPGTPAAPQGDGVENPALPPPSSDGSVVDFSASGYPGFSDVMDLRARGALSNDIAFRVRAPFGSLWRAEVFDTFDGTRWTRSGSPLRALEANDEGGYDIPSTVDIASPGRQLVQTFFIEQTQPNVLFAAGQPHTIYFPAGGLRVDRDLSVRSPIFLDQGLVYSVESTLPDVSPEDLRRQGRVRTITTRYVTRYLQLPTELPQRVRDLADEITAGARTEYDAVLAVQTWLQTNTRYDLTVPREPEGVDAVDHFLFDTRRGFCEHIAASMAVLLRAEGVPTRIVTGYGPGERNPFTGYYEVRNSDAHAWLEVLYPGAGWIAYDPTFGVPALPDAWGSPAGADLLAWAGRQFQDHVPAGVRQAAGGAVRTVVGAVRSAGHAWPLVVLIGIAGALATFLRRRHGREQASRAPDRIGEAYDELVTALAAAGHPPDPASTPSEVRAAAIGDAALTGAAADAADLVVTTFERARYRRPAERPSDADVMRASAAAARVRELTRHR